MPVKRPEFKPKQYTPDDLVKLWNEMGASLPEELRTQVAELIKTDTVLQTNLKASHARADIFHQALSYVDNKQAEWDGYWKENAAVVEEGRAAKARLATLEAQYGDLDEYEPSTDGNKMRSPAGQYVSKTDFDKALAERIQANSEMMGQSFSQVFTHGLTIVQRHLKEFNGEPLDMADFGQFMAEKGFTDPSQYQVAYDAYVAPRRTEREKVNYKEALERAKKEGVEETLSKMNFPVNPRPVEISPLRANLQSRAAAKAGHKPEGPFIDPREAARSGLRGEPFPGVPPKS